MPEVLVRRQVGHLQAIAGGVELPAVIDAAQAALFIATEEQRGAAVRAAMIEDADAARAVAEGDQPFAKQHQAQRIAIGDQFR